jgi:hypothetical protein
MLHIHRCALALTTLRFTVPANQTVAIRYQTGHTSIRPVPDD